MAATPPPGESGAADKDGESPLPSWEKLDFGAGLQELTILRAIEEYLSYHGFEKSLKSLKKEAGSTLNSMGYNGAATACSPEAMLEAFDEGNGHSFFRMWRRLDTNRAHGSLELRLRVHFAILPMRKRLQNNEKFPRQKQGEFEELKDYLAEHQDESGSLVAFYALPFVPAPHQHPELKHIFTRAWLDELRSDTLRVLRQLCSQQKAPRAPFLYALVEGPISGSNSALYPVRELIQVAELALKALKNESTPSSSSTCAQPNVGPPHGHGSMSSQNQLQPPGLASSGSYHVGNLVGHRDAPPNASTTTAALQQLQNDFSSASQHSGSASASGGSAVGGQGCGGPVAGAGGRSAGGGASSSSSLEVHDDLRRRLSQIMEKMSSLGSAGRISRETRGEMKSRGGHSRGVASRQSLYSRYGARPKGSRQSTLYSRSSGRSTFQPSLIGPCARFAFGRIRDALKAPTSDKQELFVSILKHCCSAFDPLADRRAFLHGVCCFDVLCVNPRAQTSVSNSPPNGLVVDPQADGSEAFDTFLEFDACIALIAVIACEAGGRYYLGQRAKMLVRGLMQHLGRSDNTELQGLVALQRLSLSQRMQEAMIAENLMAWILGEFREFILSSLAFGPPAGDLLNQVSASAPGSSGSAGSMNNAGPLQHQNFVGGMGVSSTSSLQCGPPGVSLSTEFTPGQLVTTSAGGGTTTTQTTAGLDPDVLHNAFQQVGRFVRDTAEQQYYSPPGTMTIAGTGAPGNSTDGNINYNMGVVGGSSASSFSGGGFAAQPPGVGGLVDGGNGPLGDAGIPSRTSSQENSFDAAGKISEITLEFGSALLMNLALRKEGKTRLEKVPGVVPVLAALMLSPHIEAQVRTYANGTLYSLLGRSFFRQQAEAIGFRQILQSLLDESRKAGVNMNNGSTPSGSSSAGMSSNGAPQQQELNAFGRQIECLLEQFSKTPDAAQLEEEEEEIDEGDEECFLAEEELSAWVIPPNSKASLLSEQFTLSADSATYQDGQRAFAAFLENMQRTIRDARESAQARRRHLLGNEGPGINPGGISITIGGMSSSTAPGGAGSQHMMAPGSGGGHPGSSGGNGAVVYSYHGGSTHSYHPGASPTRTNSHGGGGGSAGGFLNGSLLVGGSSATSSHSAYNLGGQHLHGGSSGNGGVASSSSNSGGSNDFPPAFQHPPGVGDLPSSSSIHGGPSTLPPGQDPQQFVLAQHQHHPGHHSSSSSSGNPEQGGVVTSARTSHGGAPSSLQVIMNTSARNQSAFGSQAKTVIQGSTLIANSTGLLVNSMRTRNSNQGGVSATGGAAPLTGLFSPPASTPEPPSAGAGKKKSYGSGVGASSAKEQSGLSAKSKQKGGPAKQSLSSRKDQPAPKERSKPRSSFFGIGR
ncbi:unnamed protein product [Amoebophrya sp. A25]|nr:unnamed protein product [Amoebophrya sp. A25]|eukprot:GSA25T00005996001.1